MVKYYYLLLLLVFGFTTKSFALESTKVQILKSSELQTESVDYFYSLLLSALQETEPEYGAFELIAKDLPYSQQRSLELLNDNQGLDVIHTMTNPDRETKYIAVKVPLLKGLMGYRALLTNKTNVSRIDSLKQLSDLKKLIACQGTHWPDSDILEQNGLSVARILVFESMFEMTAKGRCDYFPRGIQELEGELTKFAKQHEQLTASRNILLHYPTAMYFFVGKRNARLAIRLTDGLNQLQHSGKLNDMLMKSPLMESVLPLSKWQDVRVFELENPNFNDHALKDHFISLGKR